MLISKSTRARWLALSLIAGPWDKSGIADRLKRSLPGDFEASEKLLGRLRVHFEGSAPPNVDVLTEYLLSESLLKEVLDGPAIKGPLLDLPVMATMPDSLITFPLPELATTSDLADWLSVLDNELAWFSDCRSQQAQVSEQKLHHYNYMWVPKRSGSLRMIEAPKPRLKEIQRKILAQILNRVPTHDSAHGFTRGRSIKTYVEPHTNKEVVLRLDLEDFFHSVPTARIGALFRLLGYPKNVAWVLQGLCTTSTSAALAGQPFEKLPWSTRKRLQNPHLAQGAPTSAPLANLCAWRLDCRLQGLAKKFDLEYTRYADDMAFSGPRRLARMSDFVESLVGAIALDEGFRLNHRKTRMRLRSQRQSLAGIVANEKLNINRQDFDRLKATLHNCAKFGPTAQNVNGHPNFQAHLRGRIAHVAWLSPKKGEKLRKLWSQIDWTR